MVGRVGRLKVLGNSRPPQLSRLVPTRQAPARPHSPTYSAHILTVGLDGFYAAGPGELPMPT